MPKARIKGSVYNTDTARCLSKHFDTNPGFSQSCRDNGVTGKCDEGLYVTSRGKYFVCTEYLVHERSEAVDTYELSDFEIQPLDAAGAERWCSEHGVEWNPRLMKFSPKGQFTFTISPTSYRHLVEASERTGLTKSYIMDVLLESLGPDISKEDFMSRNAANRVFRRKE